MATIDFPTEFAVCRTTSEANSLYKRLYRDNGITRCSDDYWRLSETHRRTMERLSGLAVEPKPIKQPKPVEGPRNNDVRNWARRQGIPLASKGRLPRDIVEQYQAAHPAGDGD